MGISGITYTGFKSHFLKIRHFFYSDRQGFRGKNGFDMKEVFTVKVFSKQTSTDH